MNFLLIHGGAHGAWCWEALIGALARRGHRGIALDLPGAGADMTPRPTVTQAMCVEAVGRFIASEGLGRFVLVGHSIAGFILPELIERHESSLVEAIYLAAFALEPGEKGIDYIPSPRYEAYLQTTPDPPDEGCLRPDYDGARERFFHDMSEEEARRHFAQLTPQPFTPYLEPATRSPRAVSVPARYIICRGDRNLPMAIYEAFAARVGGMTCYIDSGHDAMLLAPEALAELLVHGHA